MNATEDLCAYCGEPIDPEEERAYPYVGSSNPTHVRCAEDAALEEVADTYNKQGDKGVRALDRQADIQAELDQ